MMRRAGLVLAALAGCSVAPPPPVPHPPPEDPIRAMYLVAARCYEAGDYEQSLAVCEEVLRFAPYFAPAVALMGDLQYVRGTHQLTLEILARARLDQVEAAIEEGRKHLFAGDFDLAEKCALLALDLAPLLPPEMDIQLRIARAQAVLDWVRAFRED